MPTITLHAAVETSTYTERFNAAMKQRGLKIQEAADALGLSYNAVRKLVLGTSKSMSAANNVAAAQLFGVNPDWLATGKGPMRPASDDAPGTPANGGKAQLLSLDAFTVPQELQWTAVQTTSELPASFIVAAPDDALAPDVPKGARLMFDRHDGGQLEPGDGVLIETAEGHRALRMYAQAAGGWMAAARHPAYQSFDSQRDGLRVLAVLTGKLGRKI